MTAVGSGSLPSSAHRGALGCHVYAGTLPDSRGGMKKQLFLMALGTFALGCGNDHTTASTSANPDAESCSKGSISAGDVKTGTLNGASCRHYDHFYAEDTIPFDSYSFRADKGKGYLFTLDAADRTSGWDAFLELVTVNPNTGEEQLLAISDDEGGAVNGDGGQLFSQFYFIAPASGTYYLRAAGLDLPDTSAYLLTAKSCDSPIPQITGTLAPSTQTLSSSDCVLAQPAFVNDSSNVKLFSLHLGANETKTITVTSTDFPPGFQVYGPAWGVSCRYHYEGCGGGVAEVQKSNSVSFTITGSGDQQCNNVRRASDATNVSASLLGNSISGCEYFNYPGQYTIAVGSFFGGLGSFTIAVTDQTAPGRRVGADAPIKNPTLNFLTRKPLRASEYLNRAH